MRDTHTELLEALRSLIGKSCERSLATNSLKLRFDGAPGGKGRAYIWIDPPWRLSLDGRFITGSADWPVWDGVAEPEVNRPLWDAWCDLFAPLNRTALAEVAVGSTFADLTLEFETGHRIETFGNGGDGYWWYYRDRLTGEVFEVGAECISHEWAEVAEAESSAAPPDTSIATVEITGWIDGFQKVSCTKLLRSELGLGLADAKQVTDNILEGLHQSLSVSSHPAAENLARALQSLGAKAHVGDS